MGGGPPACGHRRTSSGGPWQARGLGCCSRSSPAGAPGRAPCRLLASRCAGSATGRAAGRLFSRIGGHTSMEADSSCSCGSGQGCVRERACGFPPEGRVQSATVPVLVRVLLPGPPSAPRASRNCAPRPEALSSPTGHPGAGHLQWKLWGWERVRERRNLRPGLSLLGSTVAALSGSVHDGLALMHRGPCCPMRLSLGCWRRPQSLN